MEYFEKVVSEGCSKVFLVVADFNPRAKQLYQRIGYKEVGKIPNLYKNGITEYLMMKEL
jgi:ribosomal protein S18 acetylase RimI-like enzyme